MRVLAVVFAALAVAVAATEQESPSIYGMQDLKIFPNTESKQHFIIKHEGEQGLDFLRVPRALNSGVNVLAAADQVVEDASKVIEHELTLNRRA